MKILKIEHANIYIFFQLIVCFEKDTKRSEAKDKKNGEISSIDNNKDTCVQNKRSHHTMKKTMQNNWKILPLLVDKITFGVFCGLEIYFYFVYIPR